jgi:hypothetical protein
MERIHPVRDRVSGGTVAMTVVLLLGVLVAGYGALGGGRLAFWAGMLITLAGVMSGVVRLVVQGKR